MNSYRRGLRGGVLVNPKLFILEKVNLDPHTNCWSNLVKLSQTWSNVLKTCISWYGSLHQPYGEIVDLTNERLLHDLVAKSLITLAYEGKTRQF